MSKQIFNQEIAEAYCQQDETVENLLYVLEVDTFFLYQEDIGYYKMLDEKAFEDDVFKFVMKKGYKSITRRVIKDIIYNISVILYRRRESADSDWVAINNKYAINLETFEIEPVERKHYAFFHYNVDKDVIFDTSHKPKFFYKFISEVMVDNEGKASRELMYTLQEMFGFYLAPRLKPEVMFFLVGKGANGKSVVLNILKHIVGKEFISAMSIQYITTNNWALGQLVGKKLNLCNEEESKYMKSDTFKAVVSGDTVQADRKFTSSITFDPKTKFLFATNELPTFDSINEGIRRRIKIFPFNKYFAEDDRNLLLKEPFGERSINPFNDEIQLIIAWALRGWKRLKENNYKFTQSKLIDSMMTEFENVVSSALMYTREEYEIDNDSFINNVDLYEGYKLWCNTNGKKPMSKHKYLKDIHTNLGAKRKTQWSSEHNRMTRGIGLRIITEQDPQSQIDF